MFALDSTLKFENVNFPCGASSGTNKNQHTYRLRSNVASLYYCPVSTYLVSVCVSREQDNDMLSCLVSDCCCAGRAGGGGWCPSPPAGRPRVSPRLSSDKFKTYNRQNQAAAAAVPQRRRRDVTLEHSGTNPTNVTTVGGRVGVTQKMFPRLL